MEDMGLKKVLVTGADGYIGSVLCAKLIKQGYNILGIDTFYYRDTFLGSPRSSKYIIYNDIRTIAEKDLKGIDAIIHLAGLSNDAMGEINAGLTHNINYQGTIRLARLAKKVGVRRFIFSSSCSVYGKAGEDIAHEGVNPKPLTIYAKAKLQAEKGLSNLADDNFCVCLLRYSTVYGYSPKFRDDLVVNNLVANMIVNKKIKIMSDGTPWRPLIDVRDLSEIIIEFLKASSKKVNNQLFNIGLGRGNFQVREIAEMIHEIVPQSEIVYTGEHGTDTRSYKVSFDKFLNAFPQVKQKWPLRKAIKNLIEILAREGFGEKDLVNGKFTRLSILKQLIYKNRIQVIPI